MRALHYYENMFHNPLVIDYLYRDNNLSLSRLLKVHHENTREIRPNLVWVLFIWFYDSDGVGDFHIPRLGQQ